MTFAEILLEYRVEHGFTQTELAQLLEIEQSDVSNYESGKRKPTRRNQAIMLRKLKIWEETEM